MILARSCDLERTHVEERDERTDCAMDMGTYLLAPNKIIASYRSSFQSREGDDPAEFFIRSQPSSMAYYRTVLISDNGFVFSHATNNVVFSLLLISSL